MVLSRQEGSIILSNKALGSKVRHGLCLFLRDRPVDACSHGVFCIDTHRMRFFHPEGLHRLHRERARKYKRHLRVEARFSFFVATVKHRLLRRVLRWVHRRY